MSMRPPQTGQRMKCSDPSFGSPPTRLPMYWPRLTSGTRRRADFCFDLVRITDLAISGRRGASHNYRERDAMNMKFAVEAVNLLPVNAPPAISAIQRPRDH